MATSPRSGMAVPMDDLPEDLRVPTSGQPVPATALPADFIIPMMGDEPAPSMANTLMRQIGLTARAAGPVAMGALGGGAIGGPPGAAIGALGVGVGTMVGDPLISLFNRATGSNIRTPSQVIEGAMTSMGLPEPATSSERVMQDIVRAGTSAAGSARGAGVMAENILRGAGMSGAAVTGPAAPISAQVMQTLARYPAQQVAGAAMAGGAGGSLREAEASPLAQIGGAMAAGMVAPGGPRLPVTARALEAPGALVKPFTQTGREIIVGNVLNRLATTPGQTAQKLAQAEPLVPGVRPTTAATAFDPGLAAAETAIRSLAPGEFGARLSANQQALLDAYRRLSGKPGSIPYAEAKRKAITSPMREEAFASVTVNPETFQSGIALTVNKAIDNIRSSPAGVRQDVETAMNWATSRISKARTPMELYEVRKDLASAMQGKYNQDVPSLRLAKGQLSDVVRTMDDVIEAAAPGFRAYMDKYSKMSQPIDQMRVLQEIERRATTGQPNLLTGEPVIAAGSLRRQLATRVDEIGTELSPAAQRKLDNIVDEINRGMAATAPGIKPPGSNTFQNMSMGNLIGRVFSESLANDTTLRTMTRPLDFLYRLPDQQVQQLLVEAMLDPKLAAQMMSKANMMRVEPLARSLRQKAEQLGFGSAIGAAGTQ
jgi:hypothetical protein